jgi:hypothetical protein
MTVGNLMHDACQISGIYGAGWRQFFLSTRTVYLWVVAPLRDENNGGSVTRLSWPIGSSRVTPRKMKHHGDGNSAGEPAEGLRIRILRMDPISIDAFVRLRISLSAGLVGRTPRCLGLVM